MTWEEMGSTIMRQQAAGYCWRCRTSGNKLALDPMGSADDKLHLSLCQKCRRERSNISELYRRLGRYVQPNRNVEPIF
jgi:predicted anti-sigma-YlaC factor YlaD